MSKICRTFAANFEMHMKKLQYIQPQIGVEAVHADATVMVLGSGSHPDAPARRGRGEEVIE